MKKSLSILVLGIFLFNTMGYYFVFKVNQSIIQAEIRGMIRSGVHHTSYTLVKVDHPEANPKFKMLDHNEFTYCGQLYDIVCQTVKGNTTWFYCLNDRQEEKLISGFERIQKLDPSLGSSGKTKQAQAIIYHMITLALVRGPVVLEYPDPLNVTFGFIKIQPVSPLQIPFSPPPELS
jgi:hypothetical protein